MQRAKSLAEACRVLEKDAAEGRKHELEELRKVRSSEFVEIFLKGDEVQLYVTLTLVYRVIPAPEGSASRFCDECLDSARRAILTHQSCIHLLEKSEHLLAMHVHWYVSPVAVVQLGAVVLTGVD